MSYMQQEVLHFVENNDVKFIRLAFCGLDGITRNLAILPAQLPRALEEGIPFDLFAVDGFRDAALSDILLVPDPATLTVLPWRPQQGRVIRFYCALRNPDGSAFSCDTRGVLQAAVDDCAKAGYVCKMGTECEFTLFLTDEHGHPTLTPLDNGGYMDMAPLDKGEDVRREICLALDEMGITPEASHHESGRGQNRIAFMFSDPLTCADNFLSFKTLVKAVAARNGLYASFMPKPLPMDSGNGLHIDLSLYKDGQRLFRQRADGHSLEAEAFMAGILSRCGEMTAFLNPTANSYEIGRASCRERV